MMHLSQDFRRSLALLTYLPPASGACRRCFATGGCGYPRISRFEEAASLSIAQRISFGSLMQDKPDTYRSPLERRPKFVKAIGMISIENSSLEVLLAELLAALLGIHGEFGILIYFTPKAAIPRLDMIDNVTEPSLAGHPELAARIRAIVKRAKAAIGRRHDVMHTLWAFDHPADGVQQILLPSFKGGEVKLSTLDKLVADYRGLIEETAPLIDDVQKVRGFGWKAPYR
ncbi:hypothetical protein QCM80_16010 [Bradyrhizobium sp. SSUT112]|uniref:hypothetical protein n=1 Tax=Bradyrhizobium sp. SSUT112 TaxID=3040604 RepID=UPI0024487DC4|nr:hypothetical protein [Bradyrhizobium sp. SSUT112]MDH2352159.1 hypothetical protein [Bradyrhizobium sp. SSUT112]